MVMVDKRELILARAFTVGQGIADFKTKYRNQAGLPNDKLPAFILLDGDERDDLAAPKWSRPGVGPVRMVMSPEMYILLNKEGKPKDDDLGQRLNVLRISLTQALATDQTLLGLIGPNGNIAYRGCVTDLKSGSGLSGQMRLNFDIKYFFDPT